MSEASLEAAAAIATITGTGMQAVSHVASTIGAERMNERLKHFEVKAGAHCYFEKHKSHVIKETVWTVFSPSWWFGSHKKYLEHVCVLACTHHPGLVETFKRQRTLHGDEMTLGLILSTLATNCYDIIENSIEDTVDSTVHAWLHFGVEKKTCSSRLFEVPEVPEPEQMEHPRHLDWHRRFLCGGVFVAGVISVIACALAKWRPNRIAELASELKCEDGDPIAAVGLQRVSLE